MMEEINRWLPMLLQVGGFILALVVMFERLKAEQCRMDERFRQYVEQDQKDLQKHMEDAEKWQARHEQENKNAFNRLDHRFEGLYARIQNNDGRPLFAYREELEMVQKTLSEGQETIRKDMNSRFDRVADMIKEYFDQVKTCMRENKS